MPVIARLLSITIKPSRTTGVEMKTVTARQNGTHHLKNNRGLATVETLPLLLIFLVLMGYHIGAFGIIHTGILHNIAARVYALETFRHRSNLMYFRENNSADVFHYNNLEIRLHAIKNEKGDLGRYVSATERPINFGFINETIGRNSNTHNSVVNDINAGQRNRTDASVNPAWIKVQYGICINASCGGVARGDL